MLMDVAARHQRVVVRMNRPHAVIWHRTSETTERPGRQCEQYDGATQAAADLESMCNQVGHAAIIHAPRRRVKAAPIEAEQQSPHLWRQQRMLPALLTMPVRRDALRFEHRQGRKRDQNQQGATGGDHHHELATLEIGTEHGCS
jgi:hypothetical protein